MTNDDHVDLMVAVNTDQLTHGHGSGALGGLLKDIADKVVNDLRLKLAVVTCPEHRKRPGSVSVPRKVGNGYEFTLQRCCCERIREAVDKVLR